MSLPQFEAFALFAIVSAIREPKKHMNSWGGVELFHCCFHGGGSFSSSYHVIELVNYYYYFFHILFFSYIGMAASSRRLLVSLLIPVRQRFEHYIISFNCLSYFPILFIHLYLCSYGILQYVFSSYLNVEFIKAITNLCLMLLLEGAI